jgi:outer membrane murein-binding lipoprotein Lpp
MREIGIYAQDPDLGEILYAVAYAGDKPDFIPADGTTKVENVVDIYTVIANAQNVTAVISDTVVLATRRDIDELAQSLDNLSSQVNSQLTSQIDNLTQQLNDTASTLSNQISTVKPEASSTAPNLTYPGKIWIDSGGSVRYYDGSSWQDLQVSFADTVDGFHASLMSAPNVIVPLNGDGVLDLSGSYVKSNVYTFRRVDLSSATSEYDLQLGEEAYYVWDTTRNTSLPLRIGVSGMLYEMIVVVPNRVSYAINIALHPNNTTYSSAFQRTVMYPSGDSSAVYNWKDTNIGIYYEQVGGGGVLVSWLQTTTRNKGEKHYMTLQHSGFSFSQHMQAAHRWNDTTIPWSSLGTLLIVAPNGTIYVSVRRLV